MQVHVLMGLPGSGKTFYANSLQQAALEKDPRNRERVEIINFDLPRLLRPTVWVTMNREVLVLDGLFLTTDDVIRVLGDFKKRCPKPTKPEIKILWWEPDRDACLHNDKNRRTESSTLTIETAKLEYPDVERIKEKTGYDVTVEKKQVVRKPATFNAIEEKTQEAIKGIYIVSKPWVLGGERRSYDNDWNSVYSPIEPDEVPEFDELYQFLSVVAPTLSFLDGREIFKTLVHTRKYCDNDYYSQTVLEQYSCNMQELIDFLTKKGYMDSGED